MREVTKTRDVEAGSTQSNISTWPPHWTLQWPPHWTLQWPPHWTLQWDPHWTLQWPPFLVVLFGYLMVLFGSLSFFLVLLCCYSAR